MTDLREKIVGCLRAWTEDIIEDIDAHGEVCCAESAEDLADRILALLPKVPALRWDGAQLFLGSLRVGFVAEDRNAQMLLHAVEKTIGGAMPIDVARAAVEAAVRKALGLD